MSVLCLHVPEQWDASRSDLRWHWSDDQGASGVLGDAVALPPAREVRLLVPSSQVLHTQLEITRRGRWQDTLPYQLEDRLLGDPDELHVVAGAAGLDGLTPVAAIDRQWLRAAIDRATALGAPPQSAYSAATVEARETGEWLALVAPEGSMLIGEQGLPAMLDTPQGNEAPRLLLAQLAACEAERRPRRVRVRARPGIDAAAVAAAWSSSLDVPVVAGAAWTGQPTGLPEACVNLLQGRMAPRRGRLGGAGLRRWRPALVLAAVSLVVWLLALLAQTWQWQREEHQLMARREAALRRAFPETTTILDPVLQMQRGLDGLRARAGVGGGAGPAPLLARLAGLTDGLPARLRRMSYAANALELDWDCSDAACPQALQDRLREPQRGVAPDGVRVDGMQVHARIAEAQP